MDDGFTLLELSIVLVIIGLIIGGITVGQDLVKSAETNSVVTDVGKYESALNTFRLKYNAVPGDMDNATDYWGEAHATPATCITTASTGTETCNGDGDGRVKPDNNTGGESYRVWHHLANAELIKGSFNGIRTAPDYYVADVNVPSAPFNGAWHIYGFNEGFFTDSGANTLGFFAASSDMLQNKVTAFEPAYAVVVDTKLDDGMAESGNVRSEGCGTNLIEDGDAGASYDLTSTTGCGMIFNLE